MQWHVALGGVEDEQLGPDQPQQRHLVRQLELGEARDVPRPLHGREEDPRGKLADVIDANHVVGSHLDLSIARGVGLGPEQQGDIGGEVGRSTERVASKSEA